MIEKHNLRIYIYAENDVCDEQNILIDIINRFNKTNENISNLTLFPIKLDGTNLSLINSIEDTKYNTNNNDILLGLFWHKLESVIHEREIENINMIASVFKKWQNSNIPNVLIYFHKKTFSPSNSREAIEYYNLLRFKEELKVSIYLKDYTNNIDFANMFQNDLENIIGNIVDNKDKINSDKIQTSISESINTFNFDLLKVLGDPELYSSFQPAEPKNRFTSLSLNTSNSFLNEHERLKNTIYLRCDPIRPFIVHISESRAKRAVSAQKILHDIDNIDISYIKSIYPFIINKNFKWLRILIAEFTRDADVLNFQFANDPDMEVKKIVSINPIASNSIKRTNCIFCNNDFIAKRSIYNSNRSVVIQNDFPYNPFFHFLIIPKEQIHSWSDIEIEQIVDLNMTLYNFLTLQFDQNKLNLAHGFAIGCNSLPDQYLIGKNYQSFANSIVPHICKQVWGVSKLSMTIGSHLNKLCRKYNLIGIDYLGAYINELRNRNYIIFEDQNIIIYIPLVQIRTHEIQIMVKRPSTYNFLELNQSEVKSVSIAECIIIKFYSLLGVHGFQETMISHQFGNNELNIRLIISFLPVKIDSSYYEIVPEMNATFIIDNFPETTLLEMKKAFSTVVEQLNLSTQTKEAHERIDNFKKLATDLSNSNREVL